MSENTGDKSSELFERRVPATGNSIIQNITLHPGEGLVIKWIRPDFTLTLIEEFGLID